MVWFILILLCISGLSLWAASFCCRMVFYNSNGIKEDPHVLPPGSQYQQVADKMLKLVDDLEKLPFEQVYITARDGTRLAGRYYHISDGAPVLIQFHGYRSNGIREFSCGYKMAKKLGYNAIVVDERAHGESGGHIITFGIKERYDCKDWTEYASHRFGQDVPIILSGVSMGAATVLMASELNLPGNVAAILADCPYSSPGAIIRKVCCDIKLPAVLVYPFVVLGALVFGRFRIWASSAVKAVTNTHIPILLIHGEDDRFVPCDMSRQIYDACAGPKKLVTVPQAGHGLCFLVDTPGYERSFKNFLRSCGISKA